MRAHGSLLRLLLAAAALLLVGSGCAARMALKSPEQRPVVTKVHVDGARSFRVPKITALLAQRSTHPLHWFPLLQTVYPAVYLDGMTWQEDRQRIRNFYLENGFLDVRLVGSQLIRSKRTRPDGSPLFVQIRHGLIEGPESRVRGVEVVVHGDRAGVLDQEELRQSLTVTAESSAGKRFSIQNLDRVEQRLLHQLRSRSFARAEVEGIADAYPEQQAVDLRFDVYPGRPAIFGELKIEGLDRVKEKYIARHIKLRAGQPFDQRLLDETQQAIYSMGLFSMVSLNPGAGIEASVDQEQPQLERVPVHIRLRERKPRQFRLKGGMGWELGRVDGQVGVQLNHINLFDRLIQAELALSGGYAFLTEDDHGPIGSVKLGLRWPDFPVRTLTLNGSAEIFTDVQQGYKIWSPKADVGLTWMPFRPLRINFSYRLSYNDLFPDDRLSDLAAENPELALSDGYILSYFEQSVVLDLRDRPLVPGRGFFARIDLVETAAPADSDFHYVKVSGDVRAYLPLGGPRLVLAGRVGGAFLHHTREARREIPVNHRVYVGGDGSVRGWKSRYLGPTVVEGIEQADEADPESTCGRSDCLVPVGGRVGMYGSLELRGSPVPGFWVAGFTDFGRVWEDAEDFLAVGLAPPDGLQFSLGGGLRYDTPIGRIRLDVAVHPPQWTRAEYLEQRWYHAGKERRPGLWNLHFGIGESF